MFKNVELGKILKNKRAELKFSQEYLAYKLNISQSTIAAMECGKLYGFTNIKKILKYYNIDYIPYVKPFLESNKKTKLVFYDGEYYTVSEIADISLRSTQQIYTMLKNNCDIECIFELNNENEREPISPEFGKYLDELAKKDVYGYTRSSLRFVKRQANV